MKQLAAAAGLSTTAISQIQTGRTQRAHDASLMRVRTALEDQGIEFAPGGWVRRRDDARHTRSGTRKPSLTKVLAQNSRKARISLGLTRDEVANDIGESVETYARIEHGSLMPALPVLLRIAQALGQSLDRLVGNAPASREGALSEMMSPDNADMQLLMGLLQTATPSAIRLAILVLRVARYISTVESQQTGHESHGDDGEEDDED